MHIGFIVGGIIALALIICGLAALVYAKITKKEYKWPKWLVIAGVFAVISGLINFNLFNAPM